MSDTITTHDAADLLGPFNEVELKFAPRTLYTAGNTEVLETGARVSLVGSRAASRDGLARARKLARMLVERGVVVVSGLAKGIDAAAHLGAIEGGGKTIAVIGTPLNQCYPKENAELQARIMREHLCVSQFPFGYPVQPKNFPIRNRTMALLSDATVIVEAGETSGSLSQGWEALRLGRPLLVLKSLAESRALKWPTQMISYGAGILSDDNFDGFVNSLPVRDRDLRPFDLTI